MAEYIDKGALIDWLMPYVHLGEKVDPETLIADIREMKAADVAPVVHGKWEYIPESRNTYSHLRCTNCGWWTLDPSVDCDYHYCPRCGAKMDKEG